MDANVTKESGCLRLRVGNWMPHIFVVKNTQPYVMVGSLVEILELIINKLGRCSEWVFGTDVYGNELPNKTWSGLIGQLMRNEVDMTATLVSITEPRAKVIDFSTPLYMDIQSIAYKRPVVESDIAGFVKPYQSQIWILLMIALIMAFLTMFVSHRFSGSFSSAERDPNKVNAVWKASMMTIMPLLAQSCPRLPDGKRMRVMTGMWLLVAFIIGTVYRGNLKAMLILPKVNLPFDNLQELIDSKIPTIVPPGSALLQTIKESPPTSLLYQLKHQVPDIADGLREVPNVLKGKYASFISEHVQLFIIQDYYEKTKECSLYLASQKFFEATSIGLAFPKGSPLRAKVDPIIYNLREFGILEHLLQKRLQHASLCLKKESFISNKLRSLDIGDFYGVLCVYLGGMILATIVFVLELIVKKNRNRDQTN